MNQKKTDNMKILILGVGDFFSRKYYSTSFLLLYDNQKILVDCPDPLRRMLYDASKRSGFQIDLPDINDVILTHLHGDHSNGLEGLGFYKRFVEGRRVTLYTIPEVATELWEHKLRASMGAITDLETHRTRHFHLKDYFRIRLFKFGKINRVKNLKIVIRRTKHYIPCFGLKIGYRGKWVGYSSDTSFDPEHIEFLADCDLILHETNIGGHTPYEKLIELPADIRRKMLLVHVPDDFDVRRSKIACASEGKILEI